MEKRSLCTGLGPELIAPSVARPPRLLPVLESCREAGKAAEGILGMRKVSLEETFWEGSGPASWLRWGRRASLCDRRREKARGGCGGSGIGGEVKPPDRGLALHPPSQPSGMKLPGSSSATALRTGRTLPGEEQGQRARALGSPCSRPLLEGHAGARRDVPATPTLWKGRIGAHRLSAGTCRIRGSVRLEKTSQTKATASPWPPRQPRYHAPRPRPRGHSAKGPPSRPANPRRHASPRALPPGSWLRKWDFCSAGSSGAFSVPGC